MLNMWEWNCKICGNGIAKYVGMSYSLLSEGGGAK